MRIGLSVDGPHLLGWQRAAGSALEAAGARIAIVVHEAVPPATRLAGFNGFLWRLADRVDHRLADRRKHLRDTEGVVPIADAFPHAARRSLPAEPGRRALAAREALAGLDLLIDLDTANGPLPSEAMPPELSQWTVSLSRSNLGPGVPRGFWEAATGAETMDVTVRDTADGRVLRQRVLGTDPLSWTAQRRMAAMMAGPMLADALADRHRGIRAAAVPAGFDLDDRPVLGMPDARRILLAMGRKGIHVARELRARQRGLSEQWYPLLGRRGSGRLVLRDFEPIEPPRGRIWADPFPCVVRGPDGESELVVLAEEVRDDVGRGTIVVLRRKDGRWNATPIIEAGHHLSYPYLFDWRGQRYLIPESGQGGEIPLFRMGESVEQWHRETPLMSDINAVDTSLVEHEGRIWMFTSIKRGVGLGSYYCELHLFHATGFPTADWTPHPMNPVLCDARHARMGGGFLRRGDALYRVAQGARNGVYGTSIELRRIIRLDVEGYAEEPAVSVRPDWAPGLNGTHHLAEFGDFVAIDARRLVRRS